MSDVLSDTISDVRVRFAPSPTGYLHVGGARTALYNYLLAKKMGGKFVLRIEDTDLERSTEESMRMQISDLKWLGLDWDEGPDSETLKDVGEFGPYRQSQRLDIYKEHADKLIEAGLAYYCFHTDEELQKNSDPKKGHFVSAYRDMPLDEAKNKIAAGESATIRFRNDVNKEYKLNDLIRKEVVFPSDMVGDFVIIRSNGMPVYNFCCVIDDHLMNISHCFRAEEHLNNTLRQMMIYEAFEWKPPIFAHLSLILGEDKQKLSKRHGATSCNEYRVNGYLPEALNNFISLLGWSSSCGEEILSMEQLTEQFDLDRFNLSGAVFDETKLKWVNATHLRALPNQELWTRAESFLKEHGVHTERAEDWINKAIETYKPAVETFMDLVEKLKPLNDGFFEMTPEGKEALKWESSKSVVEKWISLLEAGPEVLSEENFSNYQNQVKTDCGVKGKFLFMPLRVCVIGKPHGVDLQSMVPLMGRGELVDRARKCLELTR